MKKCRSLERMCVSTDIYVLLPINHTNSFRVRTQATTVPFFETVIRYLGGLLSAYGLSHDASLLARADELGAALLPAFNTTSGFPMYAVHTRTGETAGGWAGFRTAWLAEIASCTMEYKYLAKLTGRKEYWDAAEGVMRRIYDANMTRFESVDGLLPTLWTINDGQPANGRDLILIFFTKSPNQLLHRSSINWCTCRQCIRILPQTIPLDESDRHGLTGPVLTHNERRTLSSTLPLPIALPFICDRHQSLWKCTSLPISEIRAFILLLPGITRIGRGAFT